MKTSKKPLEELKSTATNKNASVSNAEPVGRKTSTVSGPFDVCNDEHMEYYNRSAYP